MKLISKNPTGEDTAKRVRVEATTSESLHPDLSPGCESQEKSSEVQLTPPQGIKGAALSSSGPAAVNKDARYFSVVWCKKSTKKHKKWEGDAVLIIKGRSATLKSLEGKELASAFGYKVKEVEAIEEGSLFGVGGKECEIQGVITTEEYFSGRCFSDGFVPSTPQDDSSSSSAPALKAVAKQTCATKFPAFRSPHVGSLASTTSKKKFFNPPTSPVLRPNSFVMPHPSDIHQWKHNRQGLPVTNVIVEESLARCLRPHQREGIIFLYECITQMRCFDGCGAILADEMGLGKTLQCIALVWTLLRQGPYGGQPFLRKVIIVTPSSLVKNWQKEFKKWLPNRNLRVYHVDQNNKIDVYLKQPASFPVLILSYEMYMRVGSSLAAVNFDLLICDEAHRLKNANIKTTESLQNLETLRRILLTGTPVQNDLQEFFSLVDFCNPGVLGSSSSFRRVFEEPILRSQLPQASEEERELGQARARELMEVTAPFILRRTQDVIQSYLPGKVECVVFCRPQPVQLKLYERLLQTNIVRACLSSYLSTDANCHLACILALRKLCNHPLLLTSSGVDEDASTSLAQLQAEAHKSLDPDALALGLELSSGKLSVLAAMLHSLHSGLPRERIVLVSHFTKTLDILQEFCKHKGYPFLRLDGSTSSTQRLEIVDRFNSPHADCFVFLLSCKAGGLGLNLVGASRIVLYDVDWNPANDLQAMARVWRDGQARHVSVYRLLTTGTIEEKIFQRQVTKQDLSGAVLETKKDARRAKFSLEDLKDFFTLEEGTSSSTHRLLGCTCDKENEEDLIGDPDQENPSEECDFTDLPDRSCQLKSAPGHNIIGQKLGMSDLMRWEHIPGPIGGHFLQDPHLAAAEDNVTFVFRNVVSKPRNEDNVTAQP
ncbi:DNA repair and recombination protein RAD54B-like isoform X2 [Haemaphysalis longicornis]